jgi:hypothetical protein
VPTDLWEGARRLPYFYVRGGWVVCPQCALWLHEDGDAHELVPQYATLRSLMCCKCGVLLGPINQAEVEASDE